MSIWIFFKTMRVVPAPPHGYVHKPPKSSVVEFAVVIDVPSAPVFFNNRPLDKPTSS